MRSLTTTPQERSTSPDTTESSWALAGAIAKRVMSPGQQTLRCTLKPWMVCLRRVSLPKAASLPGSDGSGKRGQKQARRQRQRVAEKMAKVGS